METCVGCAFSAGTVTLMYVIGRTITWWANRIRARAMDRVEHELA